MGKRIRLRRYSRRTSSGGRGKRIAAIIIAIIAFLALSVALSVAAGLALGNLAEEVTKQLKPAAEKKPTNSTTKPTSGKTYTVQVGAFSIKGNAQKMQHKLKAAGFDTVIKQNGKLYTVQVGAYSVKANAEAMQKKLKDAGFAGIIKTK